MDQAYLTDCSEICLSGNGGSGKVKVNSVYLVKAADPLGGYKDALKKSIAKGKQTNDIAYTVGSFSLLTNAISAGETALADAGATEESLTAASTAIDNAIAGLKLKSGYSNLTAEMFQNHTAQGQPGTGAVWCAYDVFKSTGMPYGDGNVFWLNYADLSAYEKLIVTTTSGTGSPRFCMNRTENYAQDNNDPATTKFIDIAIGNGKWGADAYLTKDGNVYTIDLKKMVEERGIAYLHSMKTVGGNITVTGMYLYKYEPLAEDQMPQELTFPDYNNEPVASYTTEWTADVEGKVWTLNGFNNQNNAWDYVACGRKKETTVATITSAPIYAEVKDVVLYVGERKNVEEATVVVNDEFGFPVDTIDVTDQFLAGYTEIQATPEESGSGYSYVITIKSAAGANGSTIINKVGLYGEKQYVNEPALLREAKAELEAEIAKAKTLAESGKTYGLEAFQAAIDKAEAALANESLKSTEMKAETAALQAAEKTFEEAKEPVVEVTYFTGADGRYYLKNVASGKFWGAGNEWSTRASLVQHAEFVTLKAQEDGTYTMDSQVRNGGDRHFFDGDYMDAAPINLTIIQKSAGAEETALTAEMFHKWDGIGADAQVAEENANPVFDLNKNLNSGATVYGNPSVVYLTYANLTGNDQLVIEGTPGLQLRVLLNRLEVGNGGGDGNGGALVEKNPVIGENGKAEVDLTELEVAHLNAIKLGWGSPAGQITKIYAVKGGTGTPTYTIANGDKCFGYDGETTVLGKEVAADSENALWEILTEEDMKATLNDASKENPVDATFLILDPNFSRNNRFGKGLTSKSNGNDRNADLEPAWTFEATNKDNAGENTNFCVESWHATFTLAQNIENVPNGLYEMNAQGFYRNDNAEVKPALPYFYINEQKRDFPVKSGEENSMSDASKSFTAGLYQIEPVKVVVTDGKITLGAKNEEGLEYWCIWDNIELTYLGAATEDDIVATAIKDVEQKPAFENGAVYNLRGQKVQNPTKGLYIINGRKVVIK